MRDTIITSTILLLLSITPNILQAVEPDEANCIPRYEVHVINNLPLYDGLTVQCASKDNELGSRTITTKGDFHWQFCDNDFSTSYFCYLWWDRDRPKDLAFEVFNGNIREDVNHGNGGCYWEARGDGIYFSDSKDGNYAKKHDWGESTSSGFMMQTMKI